MLGDLQITKQMEGSILEKLLSMKILGPLDLTYIGVPPKKYVLVLLFWVELSSQFYGLWQIKYL